MDSSRRRSGSQVATVDKPTAASGAPGERPQPPRSGASRYFSCIHAHGHFPDPQHCNTFFEHCVHCCSWTSEEHIVQPQRVRLADASLPAERDTGVAASAFTLNDEDKRAIAAVLQEQRKGLEFLRNTLQTDVRHVQLMLEHVSPGGSATVAYARGSTAHSMLSQGGNGAALGVAGVDPSFGTNGGSMDPLHGGGPGMSALGLPAGSGAASVGAGGPSPHWGGGGAHGTVAYVVNSCPRAVPTPRSQRPWLPSDCCRCALPFRYGRHAPTTSRDGVRSIWRVRCRTERNGNGWHAHGDAVWSTRRGASSEPLCQCTDRSGEHPGHGPKTRLVLTLQTMQFRCCK